MSVYPNHYAEVKEESLDTLGNRLEHIDNLLVSFGQGTIEAPFFIRELKVLILSIKSISAIADMRAIKAISHRFEDYLIEVTDISDSILGDIQIFKDCLAQSAENFSLGKDENISALMRSLPAKCSFEVSDVTVTDIEVMLVMEPGLGTRIVTQELVECGYRIVNVASTIDALVLIPSMRPDLVIVSRVMPELDGVDLACAISAMPATRDIPLALLTSEAPGSDTLVDLPESVPVMRKGSNFADDVAKVFTKVGLL